MGANPACMHKSQMVHRWMISYLTCLWKTKHEPLLIIRGKPQRDQTMSSFQEWQRARLSLPGSAPYTCHYMPLDSERLKANHSLYYVAPFRSHHVMVWEATTHSLLASQERALATQNPHLQRNQVCLLRHYTLRWINLWERNLRLTINPSMTLDVQ